MRKNDTERIVRIFKLIKILKESSRTVKELMQSLEVGKDPIYDDFKLLEKIGYHIDHKDKSYFLFEDERKLTFDENERKLLSKLLSTDKNNPTSIGIRAKIKLHASFIPSAEEIAERQNARNIERLQHAIDNKLLVKLVKYLSSTPGKQAQDRLVWPLEIVEDTAQLVAIEVESNEQKNFKLQRIVDVEYSTSRKKQPEQLLQQTDIFGLSGKEKHIVKLNLSKRAWLLMKEEYPRTTSYLSSRKNKALPYRFVGEIRDFKGIRRFIMGLPGEIEVEGPQELIMYLQECLTEFSFSSKRRKV